MNRRLWFAILGLLGFGIGFWLLRTPVKIPFTVNSTGDGGDINLGDGVCDDGAGNCTLRAAIEEANASAGGDTIAFNIPRNGPHTIWPTSALPVITGPVIIDGYTQPGAEPNMQPGRGPVLKIELAAGLRITGGRSTVRGLVINRAGVGILLETKGGNVIEGNFIGTDVSGTVTLSNGIGVVINDSPTNTIGGTTARAGNVISGSVNNGVLIYGYNGNATGNVVQGNFIGTDVTGTVALGNAGSGVGLVWYADNNKIGGTSDGARNIISGNGRWGVYIDAMSDGNLVQGNFIGTDVGGSVGLGNGRDGLHIGSSADNTIGGTTAGAGNVISDNGGTTSGAGISDLSGSGVVIQFGGTTNLVQGNFIGTDVTGTVALGNGRRGVLIINAFNNTIGGTTAGAGNVISGNLAKTTGSLPQGGLVIYGAMADGNTVQGNFIGTDVTGTVALGNEQYGVVLGQFADDNKIGGTTDGAGNIISGTLGGDGVFVQGGLVQGGTGNAILSNSIFSNSGLGIDLWGEGVTPNDEGDGDTGANDLQNFPELTSATTDVAGTTVSGFLNSTPDTEFRIEFFANSACDASGSGEGEMFLGAIDVMTGPEPNPGKGGTAPITHTFTTAVPAGQFITATATDPEGNTSEFSPCTAV